LAACFWEFVFRLGELKETGEKVFVIAREVETRKLEFIRRPRITFAAGEAPPVVKHDPCTADGVEIVDG
jgi:hypothetical protein